MATPTITTAGTLNGLLLITDHEGVVNRIPKNSVCDIQDSSNSGVSRIEICHAGGVIVLLFSNSAEVTAAIASIDALY